MPFVEGPTQSQRSQELRKFFAPSKDTHAPNSGFNTLIQDDGALESFAETAVWRLACKRAMISLIDGETQYFLAGAELDGKNMDGRVDWFGCSEIPTHQSLCQYTIAAADTTSEYPCLVIEDLLEGERFCHIPVVNGSVAAYRFYAGTPIATSRGVKIGSFFLLDDNPRPDGLTLEQRKVLCALAANVMKHLEMHREAAERRRVSLMSHGIARFLDSKFRKRDEDIHDQEHKAGAYSDTEPIPNEKGPAPADAGSSDDRPAVETEDPVKHTLKSAARILRESLEIESGGVMFLDTAVSFNEAGYTDAYSDANTSVGQSMEAVAADGKDDKPVFRHNKKLPQGDHSSSSPDSQDGQSRSSENRIPAAGIMAMSTSTEHRPVQPAKKVLDCKTLQSLLNMYPEGNVWYFDEGGYFSSLEQVEQHEIHGKSGKVNRRQFDVKRRRSEEIAEATLLRERFEEARQIIFLPMWDAAAKRWYAGCLVWSHSAVPVFTVDSEIAYLSAFTNSVTVEISRLDAIRADQAKADFISSISHEFRSPLHGILASAEFLRELTNDETQSELISTVQNCGRTLLETINHILDFSKINSFEKSRSRSRSTSRENGPLDGQLPNELHSITNIATLCEEVVDGMVVAKSFDDMSNSGGLTEKSVEVVLDFEKQNWHFLTQPGALRRIIMNIFGNAQKYTDKGFIKISLQAEDPVKARARGAKGISSGKSAMSLIIKDSGRGISKEYLQHRLYTPFAQDDTFASGVGLGLSIVWSIVQQLGGLIAVRSLQGKGTEVELCLPVEKADHVPGSHTLASSIGNPQDADGTLEALREVIEKPTIALHRPSNLRRDTLSGQNMILDRVEKYISDWYGFTVSTFTEWGIVPKADVVIALEAFEPSTTSALPILRNQYIPTLLLNGTLASRDRKRYPAEMAVGHVTRPVGPYKLARHLLSIIQPGTITAISDPPEPGPLASNVNENQHPKEHPKDLLVISDTRHSPAKEPEDDLAQRFNSMNVRNTDVTSSPNEATQEPKSKAGLRILAIDDNEINLQLLQRFLSKRKDDVVDAARDGFEAVAAVQKAPKPYNVVFMDISMPGMDGFEATRKIRQYESEQAVNENADDKSYPRSYIVALTGLGASRDREEAKKCGFDDYLTKPIPFQKVGKLLKERSSR